MRLSLLLVLAACAPVVAAPSGPDVLVVCPAEFRPALAPWESYRRAQGHQLLVIAPPADAAELQATIRRVAKSGRLRYLLLVGDVPAEDASARLRQRNTVPMDYVRARINTRWGSEPLIATDYLYADADGDQKADLAVGRIPADSASELAAVVRKVLRYEQQADHGPWRRRIEVVAGDGGFGKVADALVEAAGWQVFRQCVPAGYAIGQMRTNPHSPCCPPPGEIRPRVRQQLADGCMAWVYLGHGWYTELDRVMTAHGARPLLSVGDVPQLTCGVQTPLAILVACYTGAVDAPQDCLAEEMALAERGPVAVIAATRVTMPYGNSVFGCELLRACFRDRTATVGEMLQTAQARTLAGPQDDALRTSLDALARGLSPAPADLATERREHVLMYHLLGDPLLGVRCSQELPLRTSSHIAAGDVLTIEGTSDMAGECLVELEAADRGRAAEAQILTAASQRVDAGPFHVALRVPTDAAGRCTVRAFVTGRHDSALGATSVVVERRTGGQQLSQTDDGRLVK